MQYCVFATRSSGISESFGYRKKIASILHGTQPTRLKSLSTRTTEIEKLYGYLSEASITRSNTPELERFFDQCTLYYKYAIASTATVFLPSKRQSFFYKLAPMIGLESMGVLSNTTIPE